MSTVTAFKPTALESMDRLTDMLTSPDEHVRCLGRAFASSIGPALDEWLRAEQQRGTDGLVILDVVATLGMQHVASVAAHVVAPGGEPTLIKLIVALTEDKLPRYLDAVRASDAGGSA